MAFRLRLLCIRWPHVILVDGCGAAVSIPIHDPASRSADTHGHIRIPDIVSYLQLSIIHMYSSRSSMIISAFSRSSVAGRHPCDPFSADPDVLHLAWPPEQFFTCLIFRTRSPPALRTEAHFLPLVGTFFLAPAPAFLAPHHPPLPLPRPRPLPPPLADRLFPCGPALSKSKSFIPNSLSSS